MIVSPLNSPCAELRSLIEITELPRTPTEQYSTEVFGRPGDLET